MVSTVDDFIKEKFIFIDTPPEDFLKAIVSDWGRIGGSIDTHHINLAHKYLGFDNQYAYHDALVDTRLLLSGKVGVGVRIPLRTNGIYWEKISSYKKIFEPDFKSYPIMSPADKPELEDLMLPPEGIKIYNKKGIWPLVGSSECELVYSYRWVDLMGLTLTESAFNIHTQRDFTFSEEDYSKVYPHLKHMDSILISSDKLYFLNDSLNMFAFIPLHEDG